MARAITPNHARSERRLLHWRRRALLALIIAFILVVLVPYLRNAREKAERRDEPNVYIEA